MRQLSLLGIAAWAVLATAARADDWATVKGQIVFAGGAVPERPSLKVDKDQNVCLAKGPILNEEWIVDPASKGVKNVFVWVGPADAAGKLPIHPSLAAGKLKDVEVDQPCCAFEPHAMAVREGQKLVVKNSSTIAHNVSWQGNQLKNPGGNVILPPGSQKIIELKGDRFPVSIACNIHPWMKGWVRAFDHPYYAVTNDKGEFEIKQAPVGDWKLFVWHEGAGWRDKTTGKNGEKLIIKGPATDLGKLEIKQ